ncbi:hypothetical protein GQS_01925 [Thermococcus sp. 4557]|nr:hypothetical protein GQS_01925 [Thermococcus sp. 4557]
MGQVAEHFIPYLPGFRYNPKDAKFLGKPIDFIVFDGMSEGNLRKIVFIEVKTGRYSKLSQTEKQVKKIVEQKEIYWEEVRYIPDDEVNIGNLND